MKKKKFKLKRQLLIFFIMAIAHIGRLHYILTAEVPIISDGQEYYLLAVNMYSGNGYTINELPTAYRLPGYPFLVSMLFLINFSPLTVFIAQALCDTATCYLIFRVGEIINIRSGIIASAFWAIYPPAVILSSMLMTETIFTFLLMLLFFFFIVQKEWTLFHSVIVGIASGMGILIKPFIFFMVGILTIYELRARWRNREFIKQIFVASLLCVSIVYAWAERNRQVFGEYTISTNGGVNFWIGNNASAKGGYYFPPGNEIDTIENEIVKNREGYDRGIRFILRHPLQAFALIPMKTAYLFSSQNYLFAYSDEAAFQKPYREILRMHSLTEKLHLNFLYIIVIISGAAGFLLHRQYCAQRGSIFLFSVATWILCHLVYFGTTRFLHPIIPLFAISCGAFFSYQSIRIQRKRETLLLFLFIGGFLAVLAAELWMTA